MKGHVTLRAKRSHIRRRKKAGRAISFATDRQNSTKPNSNSLTSALLLLYIYPNVAGVFYLLKIIYKLFLLKRHAT